MKANSAALGREAGKRSERLSVPGGRPREDGSPRTDAAAPEVALQQATWEEKELRLRPLCCSTMVFGKGRAVSQTWTIADFIEDTEPDEPI